jgi:hypothetical protein
MYDVYSAQNYGTPNPSEMWFSLHELLPSSTTVLVTHAGEVVATVTLNTDTAIGIPADEAFNTDLNLLRSRGEKIGEVFSFGIREDFRRSEVVLGKLFSSVYSVARFIERSSYLAITVVPAHSPFYRRKLLFSQVGEQGFHKKTGVACVLLAQPINTFDHLEDGLKDRVLEGFNLPTTVESNECARLADLAQPITAEEIRHFLNIRPEILKSADRDQRLYLETLL